MPTVSSMLLQPHFRSSRVALQKVFVRAALVAFALALLMPAAEFGSQGPPRGDRGKTAPGWLCALISFQYYPSNVLLLASPALCALARRRKDGAFHGILASTFALSTGFVLLVPLRLGSEMNWKIGFYLWILAHLLVAIAAALPVWGELEENAVRNESLRQWTADDFTGRV